MEKETNIAHRFDLAGTKPGDWFLGCRKCWFRHEAGVAAPPDCPECRSGLEVFDVKESDFKPLKNVEKT